MQQPASAEQTHQNGDKMKRMMYMVAAMLLCIVATAQESEFLRRYNVLVGRVGPAGLGVETLLDNWSKEEPDSPDQLVARFHYYIVKSQGTEIVNRRDAKYLGLAPVLSLKDSTGTDVHYYELLTYDEALFAEALKAADKAIALYPERLDFRFMKANAYLSYERESPDMALSNLIALVHEFMSGSGEWVYPQDAGAVSPVDKETFAQLMQEYCYSFYSLGTPSGYEAFYKLSVKMNSFYPKNTDFLCNIGSYHMVAQNNCKTALKYYDKVLKIKPDDYSALNNSVLAARKLKNPKLEKKYMKMLK